VIPPLDRRDGKEAAMQITDVRVYLRGDNEKLKAYASVTLDGVFAVKELKVVEGSRGLFVSMPARKRADGTFRELAHPVTRAMRDELQAHVLDAYRRAADARTH
jgi:stage V sporulation protein G